MNYGETDPQRAYLLAKIEEMEKHLKDATSQTKKAIELAESYKQKYEELHEDVEVFNELPWYEKMLHRFDL